MNHLVGGDELGLCSLLVDQSYMVHCSWMLELWRFGHSCMACRDDHDEGFVEGSLGSKWMEVLFVFQFHLVWWFCLVDFFFSKWIFRLFWLALKAWVLVCLEWSSSWKSNDLG